METFIQGMFGTVLEMSVTATFVIIFVAVIRRIITPRSVSFWLWLVALFRLLCPVSFKSAASLIGMFSKPAPTGNMSIANSAPTVAPHIINTSSTPIYAAQTAANSHPLQSLISVFAVIWLVGMAGLLIYGAVSYIRLKRRLATSILVHGNIYRSEFIASPFVCGFFMPKIYLPIFLPDNEKNFIISHEQTHIRRGDHLIKALWFIAVCIHWFNPLAWLAFRLMSKDMEMSCDEAVIKNMGEEIKADYSASLLALSTPGKLIIGTPLAFGETETKSRVKNVLNYKRPAFWVIVIAVAAVIITSVTLAANPEEKKEKSLAEQFLQYKTEYVGDNSKVGGIIRLLEYPEGVRYDYFSLQTKTEPYEVTVELLADDTTALLRAKESPMLGKDAAVLLSLIGNADIINFHLSGVRNTLNLSYSREWADGQYGRNVRDFSGSVEEMNKLLYASETEGATAETEISYSIMKLDKGETVYVKSPLGSEESELARNIIFNYMIKSSGQPGVDINTLDEYYLIRAFYDDTVTDYYAFNINGAAFLQSGENNGWRTLIDDGLYAQLKTLMDKQSEAASNGE